MKRDFLMNELGLSKEQTDKIMAQYGESVNSLKDENKRLAVFLLKTHFFLTASRNLQRRMSKSLLCLWWIFPIQLKLRGTT